MLIDITEVQVVGRYVLRLSFEDGTIGDVDVAKLVDFRGVFSPLADDSEFARVRVNPELGTVTWPCGADLDPDVLYAEIKGENIDAGAGRCAS
jgi:hypothetical protein